MCVHLSPLGINAKCSYGIWRDLLLAGLTFTIHLSPLRGFSKAYLSTSGAEGVSDAPMLRTKLTLLRRA